MWKSCAERLICAAVLAMFFQPAARAAEFVLANESGWTIEEFYIAPCGGKHWGPNQIAGVPLWSSRSFTVANIAPGCYDFMVVLPVWNQCIIAGVPLHRRMGWKISWSTVENAIVGSCSEISHVVSAGQRPLLGPGVWW